VSTFADICIASLAQRRAFLTMDPYGRLDLGLATIISFLFIDLFDNTEA
jgi:hypothetical protein